MVSMPRIIIIILLIVTKSAPIFASEVNYSIYENLYSKQNVLPLKITAILEFQEDGKRLFKHTYLEPFTESKLFVSYVRTQNGATALLYTQSGSKGVKTVSRLGHYIYLDNERFGTACIHRADIRIWFYNIMRDFIFPLPNLDIIRHDISISKTVLSSNNYTLSLSIKSIDSKLSTLFEFDEQNNLLHWQAERKCEYDTLLSNEFDVNCFNRSWHDYQKVHNRFYPTKYDIICPYSGDIIIKISIDNVHDIHVDGGSIPEIKHPRVDIIHECDSDTSFGTSLYNTLLDAFETIGNMLK